ncbi:unnamed protein product [Parajaminaea phylloscopi]
MRAAYPVPPNLQLDTPPSYPEHVNSPKVQDEGYYDRAQSLTFDDARHAVEPEQSDPGLRPYVGLQARLFLSLLSPPLISLLFTAVHLLLSSKEVDERVANTKAKLLAACAVAERQATTAASMPRYMAEAVNQRTQQTVEATVQGVGTVLYMSLTAVEAIITFIVDSYRSVFLCFIELLVRSALSLLLAAVDLMNSLINDAGHGIKAGIQAAVDGVNAFLHGALDGVNDLLQIIGKSVKIPVVAQPDLSALDNVHLPESFDQGLRELNASLPTLTELKLRMNELIQGPFQALKTDVNNTVAAFRFDATVLPVPEAQTVTFCGDIDLHPLDDLGHSLKGYMLVILLLLAGCALALVGLNVLREWWSWRCLDRELTNTQRVWREQHGVSGEESLLGSKSRLFCFLETARHPLLIGLAHRSLTKLGITSAGAQDRVQWWLSFVTHPMALVVFALGLTGFLSVQAQLMLLPHVQHRFEHQVNGTTFDFEQLATARIDSLTASASQDFADRSNALLSSAQNDLNEHLFGWVNTTTGAINATLNEFVDGVATAVNDTFAGTPLFVPVQTFVSCILLQKVVRLEEALTWLHDNAHATLPMVSPTVLMLSPNRTQELLQPVQSAAVGDGNGSTGAVGSLLQGYQEKLVTERWLFVIFLGLYGLVIVCGTLVAVLYPRAEEEAATSERQNSPDEAPWPRDHKDRWRNDGAVDPHHSITTPISPDRMVLHVRELPAEAEPDLQDSTPIVAGRSDDFWQRARMDSEDYHQSATPMDDFRRAHIGWQAQRLAGMPRSQQRSARARESDQSAYSTASERAGLRAHGDEVPGFERGPRSDRGSGSNARSSMLEDFDWVQPFPRE